MVPEYLGIPDLRRPRTEDSDKRSRTADSEPRFLSVVFVEPSRRGNTCRNNVSCQHRWSVLERES